MRSMRQHSEIKLQLARFALKQRQEKRLETEKLSKHDVELKSRKAQIKAEVAGMIADSSTREDQRNLTLAKLEADLWEQTFALTIEDRHVDLLASANALSFVNEMGVLRKGKFTVRQRIFICRSTWHNF